ncbi:MAG TPA: glutamate synthase, partial [Lachnospiraceae bacterium]|nr:glutamate synthase [Lachnospiraceae bacterium]
GVVTISLKPEKDEKTGRMNMVPVEGSEKELPADLVLIAAGFLGSEKYVTDGFKVELDGRTNVKTPTMEEFNTSVKNVYVVGDMHRGQSLVVWAISEGKNAARQIDKDLMGYTNL